LFYYHRFMCRKWTQRLGTAQPYRLTFSNCTAFVEAWGNGGSMARPRKLAVARSFVWRHSSCTAYTYVPLSHINEANLMCLQNTNYWYTTTQFTSCQTCLDIRCCTLPLKPTN